MLTLRNGTRMSSGAHDLEEPHTIWRQEAVTQATGLDRARFRNRNGCSACGYPSGCLNRSESGGLHVLMRLVTRPIHLKSLICCQSQLASLHVVRDCRHRCSLRCEIRIRKMRPRENLHPAAGLPQLTSCLQLQMRNHYSARASLKNNIVVMPSWCKLAAGIACIYWETAYGKGNYV